MNWTNSTESDGEESESVLYPQKKKIKIITAKEQASSDNDDARRLGIKNCKRVAADQERQCVTLEETNT